MKYMLLIQMTIINPGKLIITDNQVTFEPLPITEDSTIQYFDFNTNTGNLITQNYQFDNRSNSLFT